MDRIKELLGNVITERIQELVLENRSHIPKEELQRMRERSEKMDEILKTLTEEQWTCVDECISDMVDSKGQEQEFLYCAGVEDGIRIMKLIKAI